MRVRWNQLEGWLRWEGEWDMTRLQVPRPVLVCFEDDVASLIAYGPDLTSRTLPEVVRRYTEAVQAMQPLRFAVAWPAVDGTDRLMTEERRLRFALVTTVVDRSTTPATWTHRRLVCEWRGRDVRWRTSRAVRAQDEPFVAWLRDVEGVGAPDDSAALLRSALADEGFDVYVDPAGSAAALLGGDSRLPDDEPWLHVGRPSEEGKRVAVE